ncbi:MAG: glycoside hydrolase family 3 C-terminal domain-containing protein [Oscillospiraceae bacterium]
MKQRIIRAAANDGVTPRQRENRELARAAAREGIVLLKNDGALPVKPGRIALYGAGASRTVKGGTGSGEVNERHAVTILEGLELAGYEIASYGWIRDFETECREAEERWRQERGAQGAGLMNSMVQPFMPPAGRVITDADIAASDCDTAIYVVARQAGEGADKKLKNGEFDLSAAETESIRRMTAGYKNSVLVINSGSYMDIGTLDEAVSAVVWFCQQGMEGGAALADILSGRASPSGKLTDTWARRYADVPCAMQYSYLNGDTAHEYYREGIYVGYRYYDSFDAARRYPFGFGLSYTKFALNTESVTLENGTVNVAVRVKNTGAVRGKEVVQICRASEVSGSALSAGASEVSGAALSSGVSDSAVAASSSPAGVCSASSSARMASISSPGTNSFVTNASPLSAVRLTNSALAAGDGPLVMMNTAASAARMSTTSVTPMKANTFPAAEPSSRCLLSSLLISFLPSVRVCALFVEVQQPRLAVLAQLHAAPAALLEPQAVHRRVRHLQQHHQDRGERPVVGHEHGVQPPGGHALNDARDALTQALEALAPRRDHGGPVAEHRVDYLRLLAQHVLQRLILQLAHVLLHEVVVKLYADVPAGKDQPRRLRRADERAGDAQVYLLVPELLPDLACLAAALLGQRAVRPPVQAALDVAFGFAVSYKVELHMSDLFCFTGSPARYLRTMSNTFWQA